MSQNKKYIILMPPSRNEILLTVQLLVAEANANTNPTTWNKSRFEIAAVAAWWRTTVNENDDFVAFTIVFT
jgi:hypothetical protein